MKKGFAGIIVLSVLGILAMIILFVALLGFRTVDAGEVAVVTRWGAVTGRVLEPGAHVITPFMEGTNYINTKFLIYETMKDEDFKESKSDYKDGSVDTNTKDGQPVNVFYTIRFSVDSTKATWVVEKFGSEKALVDKIVRAESRSVTRTVPSNFSADELYVGSGKKEVEKLIFDEMRQKFADNGIIIDSVLVRELQFTPEYVAAIEAKQIEAVKVSTATNIALRAEQEKKAAITQAEAQAESQRLQTITLSPQYLQGEWIKKWNGQLPTYVTGDAQNLINLPR